MITNDVKEKEKLNELRKIFENAVYSGSSGSLGIVDAGRKFNVDIIKRVRNEKNTIDFENLNQAMNVFCYKMNTEMIKNLTEYLKNQANSKEINTDRGITLHIKFD